MIKPNSEEVFEKHRGGKIGTKVTRQIVNKKDLAVFYTPGVAEVCKIIAKDPGKVFDYTMKPNTVAVVTNGTAVLGLGDIGPEAALPVMEGKAMLFMELAGINAFPICIPNRDPSEVVDIVKSIAPVFGGINLEDISAPSCFEIEERLSKELTIPVFHDDQHGTAIVTLAALINALKLVKKSIEEIQIVINGAGAAGIAIARLLQKAGANQICLCDSKGIISKDRSGLNSEKQAFATGSSGTLADALVGADVFLGVSVPGVVNAEMVRSMAKDPVVFAMANPVPEVEPESIFDLAGVIATGRSDYPNQINNVLAFPGVFRGLLDSGIRTVTSEVKITAAKAIASIVKSVSKNYIIPDALNLEVPLIVAQAIKKSLDSPQG